ncbi:hypothetical protein [Bradyrhizobium sp.]|uniref:hypothetical protein n=1 Tax=Bradyrhizobium sp. TaxID=376 RepID=UPI0026158096|nr:hypothetical protein [Bradyrhizobium sp.]
MAAQIDMADVWPTPALFRAARGLLGIGQDELAEQAGCARKTVVLIESHVGATMDARRVAMVRDLAAFLEKRGIEFVRPPSGQKGTGVRFADGNREAKVTAELRDKIDRRRSARQRKIKRKTTSKR